jgi:hypothetical protein
MRWPIALLAAALLAHGAEARAAEGLYLTWGECALNGVGASSLSIPCNTDAGESDLYVAFSLGAPVDSVSAIEVVVDLQSATDPLPDWWHFESAGVGTPAGCRAGLLNASRDFTANHNCADPWAGTVGGALVQDYQPGMPRSSSRQARIRATASMSGPPLSLDAAHQYYGLKLIIPNAKSLPGECGGCGVGVCLVLNSIWLRRPGTIAGDQLLTQAPPGNANWAMWQGDDPQDCSAVPVRRSTWGEIKTLYRR